MRLFWEFVVKFFKNFCGILHMKIKVSSANVFGGGHVSSEGLLTYRNRIIFNSSRAISTPSCAASSISFKPLVLSCLISLTP